MNAQINLRKEREGIFFADESIVRIGEEELNFLKEEALHIKPKSVRLCMHRDIKDNVHEMFILHSKNTYVCPHKHPGKDVSYHIIEGVADLVLFDEQGEMVDVIPMGEYRTGRKFYYRLNEVFFYVPLVSSDFLLFHETIAGPFQREDTIYATWAPKGDDIAGGDKFQKELALRISKFRKEPHGEHNADRL